MILTRQVLKAGRLGPCHRQSKKWGTSRLSPCFNGGWSSPNNKVGYTPWCIPLLGCGTLSSVYVDHVRDFFNHPPDPNFLGTVGAHELATHAILGNFYDDCKDPNSVTCSQNISGNPPSETINALTQKQVSDLCKKCQELHPAPCGGGAVRSRFVIDWW